jgi:drug/metabolite transporter (DMT)-like permease
VARTLSGILAFVSSYYAFYYLPIGTAYFMFFGGSTLGGFLLGKFLFQESLNSLKVTSLFLALIGLVLVYSISVTSAQIWYLWLAFGSGLGAGLWNTLSKKVSDSYSALQLNGLDFLITGLVTLLISLGFQEAWSWPTLTQPWIANGLFLIMFAAAGQLVIIGFKHLDAQRGSLLMLMEIVFGIILSSLIFHERLSFMSSFGGGLIILAAALPELVGLLKHWLKPKNRNSELFKRAVIRK